jgi:prepilin-type N-terminal cleavage/methylation domain-containing protein
MTTPATNTLVRATHARAAKPLLSIRTKSRLLIQRRRAMTLVEVSVVAALSSILLGVVISFTVGLRQWDRRFREHGLHNEQAARLSNCIRDDIRQAREVSLLAESVLVITAPDESQTRYELQPDGCRRVVKQPRGASDKKVESFNIGPAKSWRLEHGAPGRLPAIIVWLEGSRPDKSSVGSILFVYAALGANLPTPPTKAGAGESPSNPEGF